MASAPARAAVATPPTSGDPAAAPPSLTASTAAWLCGIPCALLVLAAILVIGPPLGHLLRSGDVRLRFLPTYRPFVHPEPTEQGRYLVALSAPLLLSLATIAALRRRPRVAAHLQALGIAGTQLALVGLLVACIAGQYAASYGPRYTLLRNTWMHWTYFTPATLAAAAAFTALCVTAVRRAGVRTAVRGWLRESPDRRAWAFVVAAAMTAVWLLHAVHSDHSIANAPWTVRFHLGFTFDEAFAVLNGRTPLVDFSTQYGSLWPWLTALAMLAFGKTLLVFTLAMCGITAAALLAVFDVLRRVARNALVALLLYLPFLATSFFKVRGTLLQRETFGTYFAAFPLRYAGPYLLAWLTVRHVERRGGRMGAWPLFTVAGLVLLNNIDYGVAALGASIAALVWTSSPTRASLLRLAAEVAAGLAAALVLVSALTLLRAGSLPHLWRLTDYARMFAGASFGMVTIHNVLGLQVAVYLTYVAALATATVRALERAPSRALTGMLAWSGVFGLGAGSYFMGRSHPEALIASFSAWALALALLALVVVERLAGAPRRRPSLAALAVLFGVGLCVCSLAQTPLPWSQLGRFSAPFVRTADSGSDLPFVPPQDDASRTFVSSLADGSGRFVVKHGAPVAIFTTTGHRLADAYGVVNVSPYTGSDSMLTAERVEATLDALQRAGGNTAIVPVTVDHGVYDVLARRGFDILLESGRLAALDRRNGMKNIASVPLRGLPVTKWVDMRHLHPRALAGR